MEINYNLIIKYLSKQKCFTTNKGEYNYNFPDTFNKCLDNTLYRYGVTIYNNDKLNISFWSSLLTILDKSFLIPIDNDELYLVKKFIDETVDMKKHIDIKERVKLVPNSQVFEFVADVLNINLLFLDFKNLTFNVVYPNLYLNPWNKICILAKNDDLFEPIMSKEHRYFTFDNDIIKNLFLNNHITYFDNIKEYILLDTKEKVKEKEDEASVKINTKYKKTLELVDNIKVVKTNKIHDAIHKEITGAIHKEIINNKNTKEITDDIQNNKKEILVDYNHLNKTKLNKMKMDELTELYNELKLEKNNKMLKADMINNIINYLLNNK